MKLFQVYSKEFNDEQFCFHAKDINDAKMKTLKWTNYHRFSALNWETKEVLKPKYKDNIHNEYLA